MFMLSLAMKGQSLSSTPKRATRVYVTCDSREESVLSALPKAKKTEKKPFDGSYCMCES